MPYWPPLQDRHHNLARETLPQESESPLSGFLRSFFGQINLLRRLSVGGHGTIDAIHARLQRVRKQGPTERRPGMSGRFPRRLRVSTRSHLARKHPDGLGPSAGEKAVTCGKRRTSGETVPIADRVTWRSCGSGPKWKGSFAQSRKRLNACRFFPPIELTHHRPLPGGSGPLTANASESSSSREGIAGLPRYLRQGCCGWCFRFRRGHDERVGRKDGRLSRGLSE